MKLPPPEAFGLPGKFKEWRKGQEEAITDFKDSEHRFNVQIQPTGSGKSLCYMTAAVLTSGRTLILTSLKGLQKQLEDDFSVDPGLAKVMGKNAYQCRKQNTNCDWGPCNFGKRCQYKTDGGCPYYDAIAAAKRSNIVLTNYAFWHKNHSTKLGDFDLLVCDEAHNSVAHLMDALSITITRKEVAGNGILWVGKCTDKEILTWLFQLQEETSNKLEERMKAAAFSGGLTSEIREDSFKALYKLKRKLDTLKLVKGDENSWVVERCGDYITLDPLWPPEFAEPYLFRDIEKILLTSATVGKSTLHLLGIESSDSMIKEYPSHFQPWRRRITHIPTARVDYRMSNYDYAKWLNRIDQIVEQRLDRKGIVHTVSYNRCRRIINTSEHSKYMLTHTSKDTQEVIHMFKDYPPPAILCSPSVVTGWDFPYTQCEYQVIGKIPFPDMRRKVDKERHKRDRNYGCCVAMQNLVQACGRGMRYPDDLCETFIIDDHFKWFANKYKAYAPRWFLDAVVWAKKLPDKPLPKLRRKEE